MPRPKEGEATDSGWGGLAWSNLIKEEEIQ